MIEEKSKILEINQQRNIAIDDNFVILIEVHNYQYWIPFFQDNDIIEEDDHTKSRCSEEKEGSACSQTQKVQTMCSTEAGDHPEKNQSFQHQTKNKTNISPGSSHYFSTKCEEGVYW